MMVVDWWSEGVAHLASLVDAAERGVFADAHVVRGAREWLDGVPGMRARYGPPAPAAAYGGDAVKLAPAVDLTLEQAYEALKRLFKDGVRYKVDFDEYDGNVFKRFSRTLPVEVWLIADPVDDDGTRRRDEECVVAAIAISRKTLPPSLDAMPTLAAELRARLAELKAADAA